MAGRANRGSTTHTSRAKESSLVHCATADVMKDQLTFSLKPSTDKTEEYAMQQLGDNMTDDKHRHMHARLASGHQNVAMNKTTEALLMPEMNDMVA